MIPGRGGIVLRKSPLFPSFSFFTSLALRLGRLGLLSSPPNIYVRLSFRLYLVHSQEYQLSFVE